MTAGQAPSPPGVLRAAGQFPSAVWICTDALRHGDSFPGYRLELYRYRPGPMPLSLRWPGALAGQHRRLTGRPDLLTGTNR